MLAVVSRACSIVDSIAIYVWTRRAGLPRQCQPLSGRGCGNPPGTCRRRSRRGPCIPKKESAIEQHRRGQGGTGQKSCITMEVIVNAVMSSTDRAWTGFEINPGPQRIKAHHFNGKRVKGIEPSCPAWEAGVLPLNYTRVEKEGNGDR
jgi:hypothetical protein